MECSNFVAPYSIYTIVVDYLNCIKIHSLHDGKSNSCVIEIN